MLLPSSDECQMRSIHIFADVQHACRTVYAERIFSFKFSLTHPLCGCGHLFPLFVWFRIFPQIESPEAQVVMRAVFYATAACWIRVRVCACYLNAPYVPLRPFMINERFKLNIAALHHPHQCNYGFFLHLIGFTSTYRFVLLIVCVCARSSDR